MRQVAQYDLKFPNGTASTDADDVATVAQRLWGSKTAVQAGVAGSGAVAAEVAVEVAVAPALGWIVAGTLSLSGTDADTDGLTIDAGWKWLRTRVVDSTLTGTGAEVTVAASGVAA